MHIIKKCPVLVNELTRSENRQYLDLNGEWEFQLDREDIGEDTGFYFESNHFNDTIMVPGCLEAQGKGLRYLEPQSPRWAGTCDMPYPGTSWYRKSFKAPSTMAGKKLWLNFGGISTDCKVWLNGTLLGEHCYGSLPFGFDVTELVRFSCDNLLVVMVENRHNYDSNTPVNIHGLGSTTIEMRWSGIYRAVELVATDHVWIDKIQVIPHAKNGKVLCICSLKSEEPVNFSAMSAAALVKGWSNGDIAGEIATKVNNDGSCQFDIELNSPQLWTDSDPYLYQLTVKILKGQEVIDSRYERFGLRDIEFDGSHILLNQKPVYLRGDMVHFHWLDSISPQTNREDLREKLKTYKEYGFNFLRHHTHFPGVEYLEVCDELGLLCHNELGVAGGSWGIEEGHREYMWEKMLQRDINHPSVIIWCMGNELIATREQIETFRQITFGLDETRLLLTNSPGWFVSKDGKLDRAPIHHEFRRAGASFIDVSLMEKYQSAQRPWRMIFAKDRAEKAGLSEYLGLFAQNTQKLQAACRKILIEQIRLNNDNICDMWNFHGMVYEGYQLCTFRDSGSFLWGVVDDYFGPKMVSPEEMRMYSGDTVLLWGTKWQSRLINVSGNRAWLPVTILCSHYGKEEIKDAVLIVTIEHQNRDILFTLKKEGIHQKNGSVKLLDSEIYHILKEMKTQKLTLKATLQYNGISTRNEWHLWIFSPNHSLEMNRPVYLHNLCTDLFLHLNRSYGLANADINTLPDDGVVVSDTLDESLISYLERGGRALFAARLKLPGEICEWGAGRSEYPRGTIIANHPLMDEFPHEGWCDIPFAAMMSYAEELDGNRNSLGFVIGLRDWPSDLEPIIMGCPSFKQENPQKLAHLFEVAVGKGKLMVTSFDLGSLKAVNPATAYFTEVLLKYLTGESFAPKINVEPGFLRKLMGRGMDITRQITQEASATRQSIK